MAGDSQSDSSVLLAMILRTVNKHSTKWRAIQAKKILVQRSWIDILDHK